MDHHNMELQYLLEAEASPPRSMPTETTPSRLKALDEVKRNSLSASTS
jgi:hypothetical protein